MQLRSIAPCPHTPNNNVTTLYEQDVRDKQPSLWKLQGNGCVDRVCGVKGAPQRCGIVTIDVEQVAWFER